MTGTDDQAPGIHPIIDRGPTGDGPSELFSPELALVDPVAAAGARAALPERPWDLALDRARHRPDAPVARVPRVAERRIALPATAPAERTRPQGPDRRRRQSVGVGAVRRLAWMTCWAIVITGLALVAELHAPNAPALGAEEKPVVPAPRVAPRPVHGVGYVIGPNSGFRVGVEGRVIGNFTLPIPCVSGVELPRLPLGADATFSFNGTIKWRGGRSVRVWVHGRFTSPSVAAGEVTVHGAGCPGHPIAFVAQATS
jgi:hypothetical protein